MDTTEQIFIIKASGKGTLSFQVPLTITGFEVKQLYLDRIGGDMRYLRLIFAGKNIGDRDTLEEKKVVKDSTLHAVMRVFSCKGHCPDCQGTVPDTPVVEAEPPHTNN